MTGTVTGTVTGADEHAACLLHLAGVDVLDGTPLLDIKPSAPALDPGGPVPTGWLADAHRAGRTAKTHRSDDRFAATDRDDQA